MPKILLVEDDNNLREIFELRLIAEGYQTVTAGNGEEALVIAMKERPDLIIADVMMPKLSGFEMLETLRAAPEMATTKTIMMTALGQAEDRARGESLGVIKYLVKSQVTLEDFVRVVREVVSPDNAATGETPVPADVPANSQLQNNPESEQSMQEDTQATPAEPSADATTPNPINDAGTTAPAQASTEQEQSVVQDQINNFVNAEPSAAPADSTPAADASVTPSVEPAAAPSTDATPAAFPPATPPAEAAPTPPVESGDGTESPANNTL